MITMMRNLLLAAVLGGRLVSGSPLQAAEPSLPELVAALKSADEPARLQAIDTLGHLGPKAAAAVPALTGLLEDGSALVRAHAAESLGEIGQPAKPAVDALAALLTDPEEIVRRKAIEALAKIRPGPKVGVPLFVKVIEDADPGARNRALSVLAEVGADAVPFLIEALKNEKAAYWACLVLSEIGPDAQAAVPALAEKVADPRPEVRREAILALAEIGPAAASAVTQIAAALDDKLAETPATYALGQIGKIPAEAETKIRKNAEGQDKVLHIVSLWALARIHPEDKQLVRQATEQLIERLMEEDPRVRAAAARALAALEPGPEIALPAFQKAFEDADEEVILAALDTLVQLGPLAVPRLIKALEYEGLRARVAFMLGEIGPPAASATEALAKLIGDKDPDVSNEAIHALGKIGPDAKAAVPALVAALKKRRGPICLALVFALGKIGPNAADAKPVLLKTVGSKEESLSLISAWALTQIAPECPESAAKAVPVLTAGLADPSARFRRGAAEALRNLGPRAKPAEEALKRALNDEDPEVRQAASDALEAIAG